MIAASAEPDARRTSWQTAPWWYRLLGRIPFPVLSWLMRITVWQQAVLMVRFARLARRSKVLPGGWGSSLRFGFLCALSIEENRAWIVACESLANRELAGWVRVEGREHLEQARLSGQPLLIVFPHERLSRLVQNWLNQPSLDWAPWMLRSDTSGDPCNRYLDRQRRDLVWHGRILGLEPSGLRKLLKVLHAGGVGTLCPDGGHHVDIMTPILGHRLPYPLGVARIAMHANALVVPMLAWTGFRPGSRTVTFLPPLDPAGKTEAAWREELAQLLDRMILLHPEVWSLWEDWEKSGACRAE